MKKGIKIFFIILAILVIILLIDTIQAKVFDNRPIIKITENYNGGNLYQKDNGILVYTYVFSDGTKKTVFRWEKYAPPEKEPVDLSKDNVDVNKDKVEQSFYGKVVETNSNYIIVEPNENEEIRKSSDKINIGLGENNDALYEVGTNVKITYEGAIMESYPAKVKVTKIEVKSVDKFNIVFYQKTAIKPKQKEIVIKKNEINGIDYNIYSFEGNVAINLNSDSSELKENSISLRDALLQNKITVNEIIEKANKDLNENVITGDMYEDGGSIRYQYSNYTIIKCHTLDGNRDVYIGSKDMTINDLEI